MNKIYMNFDINNKNEVFNYFKKLNNIGCIEFQIIYLTFKINKLKFHFSIYKKDLHNKKSLLNLIFKRRKLLNYLKIKNLKVYKDLLYKLKIRN